MLSYRKKHLRFKELWYDEPPQLHKVDVLVCCQAPDRVPGVFSEEKQTIVLDLAREEAALLSEVKKDTRNEIRRALRDGVKCQALDVSDNRIRKEFYNYYDDFAKAKDLSTLDRNRLEQMAAQGLFALTAARNAAGELLVYHGYLCYRSRARLLFSASGLLHVKDSAQRSLIGRANRLLHWDDICRFRVQGESKYDFGGWYAGTADPDRIRINKFKEEFGGHVVSEFNAMHGVTMQGKLGIWVWKMLKRR